MEKIYKTGLETELENALNKRSVSFFELNREQIGLFVQADLEKYPEYKKILEDKNWNGELNLDFETAVKTALEAGMEIPETSARFEIASRILHETFQTKLGTYKTKTAMVKDFVISYRIVIDPIDNPEEAYSNGDLHEFIVVSKQLKDIQRNLLIFQYTQDLKRYSLTLVEDMEDYAPLKGIITFMDYRDEIRKYQSSLQGMQVPEKMPNPPEINAKKLADDFMKLMGA